MFHSYNSFGAPDECGWCGKSATGGTCGDCQAILDQREVERIASLRSFAALIVDAPSTPPMLRDAARSMLKE